MRLTIAVLLLLYKYDTFLQNEIKALTCPLQICTDLLQELGATEEKLQSHRDVTRSSGNKPAGAHVQIYRPKVAFSASLGSNGYFGPVNTDVTLVYKNVFINVGDAYQQATGIFIAPVRGVYYFSFFYHSGTKHGTGLALYRNGKHVALTKNNPKNGGNGLTLLLEKGVQVYMVLQNGRYIWDSENVTVFSGFLINAM
uniref:C1q domain-containing protein n=1 Tax=Cyprinus carpio TaxID=7962 RepID=A0A8C1WHC0_CYPCA